VKATDPDHLRGLVPEDLIHFRWVEEVACSPDGRTVAYTVKQPAPGLHRYTGAVYLQPLDTPTAAPAVYGGEGLPSSLAWSRDGTRLAYVWCAATDTEVRVLGPGGTLRRVLVTGSPSDLDWHPDGRHLACARWVRQDDADRPQTTLDGARPTIRVIRRLRYKRDGIGFVHDRYQQICVLDLDTQTLAQVTDGECDYSQPRWSWTGDRLAFVGMAREQNTELGQGQLFVCRYPGGRPERVLPDWIGACRSPQWSPDDRHLAFAGHTEPAPTDRRIFYHVWLCALAQGTARDLSATLDQTVGNYAVGDQRPGLVNVTVRWPAAGSEIYFLATEQGATHLFRVRDGGGPPERLVDGHRVVFAYSPAAAGPVAYAYADPSTIGEVCVWERGASRQVSDLNPWLRSRRLAVPETYHYAGVDGTPVQAWMVRPVEAIEGRAYPTIVYVHCSMFSWDFSLEHQSYAQAGFVVAYFNQRGTTAGYGQAWTRWTEGRQGEQDYEEILLGVDDLVRRPFVDGARLGVTGGSCGGFMTNWIVGHTDRFKAAVTQRSITNYASKFGTSDIGPEGAIRETGAAPWEDLAAVWRQSPIAYVDRIRTPLLILHSDEDHRTPIEQAEQLFAALRWLDREVEFVWFSGESHGLSVGGRPINRIERIRRILGWFEKHLGTQAVPV
jgi:dipeptidyl aminopeptidase/acylaminoacyl peptidase